MTAPLIPCCCNCNSTTAPLLTRAGRLVCRSCYCPLGLDDDKGDADPRDPMPGQETLL